MTRTHGALPAIAAALLFLFSATLVGAAGFLGGTLIYGLDHYSW